MFRYYVGALVLVFGLPLSTLAQSTVDSAKPASSVSEEALDFELLHPNSLTVTGALTGLAVGPGDGGGGDPTAQEFIRMARQLAEFFTANPDGAELAFKPEDFAKTVGRIEESLKDEKAPDLVTFTPRPVMDQNRVPKAAFFDRRNGSVTIHRDYWRKATSNEKLTLITMEIFGLISVRSNRYEMASRLLRDRTAAILAIPLPDDSAFATPGMWVVGQDHGQFRRISEDDVVIDVGALGTNVAATRRFVRFLTNPKGDPKWSAQVERAHAMRRPAFFLLTGPEADRVIVYSLYPTRRRSDGQPGFGVYGLILKRIGQVHDGDCAGEAKSVPSAVRIRTCFLGSGNYTYHDFQLSRTLGDSVERETLDGLRARLGRDLKDSLLRMFAKDLHNLQTVVAANFIHDYSVLVVDTTTDDIVTRTYKDLVLEASARANGLVPTFEGPYAQAWFWGRLPSNRPKDFASVRFFKALQMLAAERMGFLDHMTLCGSEQGPKLISLDRLVQLRASRRCVGQPTTHFPDLQAELMYEMVKLGYRYDAPTESWVKDSSSASVPAFTPDYSGTITTEVRMRFMTERLDDAGKVRVIRSLIETVSIEERMLIYLSYVLSASSYRLPQSEFGSLSARAWRDVLEAPAWLHKKFEFQRVTEKLFEQAIRGDSLSATLSREIITKTPEMPWFGQFHFNAVVDAMNSPGCMQPKVASGKRARICVESSDPRAVYQSIVNNPNVPRALRDQAAGYLRN